MLWAILGFFGIVLVLFLLKKPAGSRSNPALAIPRGPMAQLPTPNKPELPPGMYTFGFIWRWDGQDWHLETPPTCEPITRIFGAGGALWAASWKEIWQHTGEVWVRHPMSARLYGLHGWSDGLFMAAGGRAVFLMEGDAIKPLTKLPNFISALWGASADDVYAVGWEGMISHLKNGEWHNEDSGVTARLTGVWGQKGEVLVVGDEGVILHSTQSGTWEPEAIPVDDSGRAHSFVGLWGDGHDTYYAVTRDGAILSRRAGGWLVEHHNRAQLVGIQGSEGHIFTSGLGGRIWRSTGDGQWHDESAGAQRHSINTVYCEDGQTWVGGDWFFQV